ncbi:MAG: peptidyl-prolyl cis-trans isomerase [Pseudomonadota bacterium]
MLQDIREKSVGTGGKVFLAAILILLAGTGLNYTLTPKQFVAKVDGDEVSLRDVNNAFINQLRQYGDAELPESFLNQLRAAAVEAVIDDTVLRRHLIEEGFAVSDDAVRQAILEDPSFQTDGKFDRELYDQLLASNQLSVLGYEQDRRRSMMVGQFQQTLIDSAFITPEEFRKRIELSGQQREVEFATVKAASYLEGVTVSEDEIAVWYEANPDRFVTEEELTLDYVLLDENLARAGITVDETTIRDYYQTVRSQYTGEEQRRARHVLLDSGDAELAASLLERIRGGESFEEIAAENSIDGASARNGGDLGFVTEDVFVGPVSDALFAMQPGDISDVVESSFGLHILRLDEIRAGTPPEFEAVQEDVTEQYYSERVGPELEALKDTLTDQFFEQAGLEQIATSLGATVNRVEAFTPSSVLPFGREEALVNALFGEDAIGEGAVSEPVELSGDRTVVARVVARKPEGRQPLADVSDEIRERLTETAAEEIANERGAQLAGALRTAPNVDFEALVLNSGAELAEKRFIDRRDVTAPAALAAAVFDAPRPSPGAPQVGSVSAPGVGYIIYRVSDVRPGSVPDLPQAQIDAGRRQLASQIGTSQVIAIRSALRDDADVQMGDLLENAQGL